MKKSVIGFAISFTLTLLSLFPMGFWLFLYAPDLNSVRYYSDDRNYDTFSCTVRDYKVMEDYIFIIFDHKQEEYYEEFKIDGENVDIALSNGLLDVLQKGEVFTVTSASAFLGDSWDYPIAKLEHNGKTIIPFEEGKQNIVDVQQLAEDAAINFITISGSIFVLLVIVDVICLVGFVKTGITKKIL